MTQTKLTQAGERTQHTPGPWEVNPTGDIGPWMVGNSESEIANCAGSDVPQKEMESNARLIAASPELFWALLEIIHGAVVHNRQEHRITNYALNLAQKAIAKAEGK